MILHEKRNEDILLLHSFALGGSIHADSPAGILVYIHYRMIELSNMNIQNILYSDRKVK